MLETMSASKNNLNGGGSAAAVSGLFSDSDAPVSSHQSTRPKPIESNFVPAVKSSPQAVQQQKKMPAENANRSSDKKILVKAATSGVGNEHKKQKSPSQSTAIVPMQKDMNTEREIGIPAFINFKFDLEAIVKASGLQQRVPPSDL